jgi:hypothetical protein
MLPPSASASADTKSTRNNEFVDLTKRVDDIIYQNRKDGFKSNRSMYRRVFNNLLKESIPVDQFGDPYFYSNKEDKTVSICITLPSSLIVEVNEYCKNKKLTRSRLIRKVLEYSLNLKKTD